MEAGIGCELLRTLLDDPPAKYRKVDSMQFFRDVMSKEVIRETTRKVGGPGKMIVIDENALAKQKYHRSRPAARETCWVLGIYDVYKQRESLNSSIIRANRR